MAYWDDWGLLNSRPEEKNAENAMLWTLEHMLLSGESKNDALQTAIWRCRTLKPGIYVQNPQFNVVAPAIEADNYMSPDQLIAIMGYSYLAGLDHHKYIWWEIKRQKLRYDNVTPETPKRYIHPRDLALYGIFNGSIIGWLLFPILFISSLISCLRPQHETSTKILVWVKCQILMRDSYCFKLMFMLCSLLVKLRNGSWENVFKIYFPRVDHPIHVLVGSKR